MSDYKTTIRGIVHGDKVIGLSPDVYDRRDNVQ